MNDPLTSSARAAPQAIAVGRLLAGVLGVAALLAAPLSCKQEPGAPEEVCHGTADGGLTFDEFWACWANASCAAAVDCELAEASFVEPCTTYLTRSAGYADMRASLASGTTRYDPVAARACLAGIRGVTATCETGVPRVPACEQVLKPVLVETGARCLPGRSSCKEPTDVCAGADCGRTCQPSGGLGQPCSHLSVRCDAGLFCDGVTQTCAALRPPGSSCSSNECESSSYCGAYSHVCIPRPVEGEPCGPGGSLCAAGTFCLSTGDAGSDAGVCRPWVPVGGSCAAAECVPSASCDASKTCIARKASGSSCAATTECNEPLVCRAGHCQAAASEGDPCSSTADCAASLTCDSVMRTCEPHKTAEPGEACTADTLRCAYDSEYEAMPACDGVATNPDGGAGTAGVCHVPRVGDACTTTRQCPSSSYCDGLDAGTQGVCRSGAPGSPCDRRGECATGLFCSPQGCQPRVARGGACTATQQCAVPLACRVDPSDGGTTCGDRGSAGASCRGSGDQCKAPNLCIGGVCTPAMTLGAPCEHWCYTGLCLPVNRDKGVLGKCEPYLVDGAACALDADCASQSCVRGTCVAACE